MNVNLDRLRQLTTDVELALIDLKNKRRALEEALRAATGRPPKTKRRTVDERRERC